MVLYDEWFVDHFVSIIQLRAIVEVDVIQLSVPVSRVDVPEEMVFGFYFQYCFLELGTPYTLVPDSVQYSKRRAMGHQDIHFLINLPITGSILRCVHKCPIIELRSMRGSKDPNSFYFHRFMLEISAMEF